MNFTIMGERYGWHPSVIRDRVKAEADERGMSWPLKTLSTTPKRRNTIDSDLASKTLRDVCLKYRITLLTISKQVDMNESVVRGIANGHRPRISRATLGRILELAAKLDTGELTLPQERVLITGVDRCPNNHPYTGRRDSRGYRVCTVCRVNKARRQFQANIERRRRKAAEKRGMAA